MLRKFQKEIKEIAKQIANGSGVRYIMADVTQGGGKSSIAALLNSELPDRKICWVVPRDSLREQGESSFCSAEGKALYGNNADIRASKNEYNPCRNTQGYITTYQAVVADPAVHRLELEKDNYILILDECHHIPDPKTVLVADEENSKEKAYYAAIKPLVDRASLVVFMSGSWERNNNEKIAFIPYRFDEQEIYEFIDTSPKDAWAFVQYGRYEATQDKAVLPLSFFEHDLSVSYIDPKTEQHKIIPSLFKCGEDELSNALHAVLSGTGALEMLDAAVKSWRHYKASQYPAAKILVIAASIELAKLYNQHLIDSGIYSLIATSEDSREARNNIRQFKGKTLPECDALVSVAMAYEGLDVSKISHVACLTNIRSRSWIEQAATRCNRIDYTDAGKDYGHIFVPKDTPITNIISIMSIGETRPVRHGFAEEVPSVDFSMVGKKKPLHLDSRIISQSETKLDGEIERIVREVKSKSQNFSMLQAAMLRITKIYGHNVEKRTQRMMVDFVKEVSEQFRADEITENDAVNATLQYREDGNVLPVPVGTSQIEHAIDKQIAELVEKKAGRNPQRKIAINKVLKQKFGARKLLTVPQKNKVLDWLLSA